MSVEDREDGGWLGEHRPAWRTYEWGEMEAKCEKLMEKYMRDEKGKMLTATV